MHLKVCYILDIDSCLHEIRRFVSRKGYPETKISDNEKNFTASKKLMNLNNISIENYYFTEQLSQHNTDWKLHSPLAPQVGGLWERIYQTAKR